MLTLHTLPTLLVVGALVATFLSIQPHQRTPRLRLWLFAWGLVFVHLCLSLVSPSSGLVGRLVETARLATVAVAGMIFVVSVTTLVFSDPTRVRILVMTGLPLVLNSVLLAWDADVRWAYLLLSSWVGIGGVFWFLVWYRRLTFYVMVHAGFSLAIGIIAFGFNWHRAYDAAFATLLVGLFGMSALLFVQRYPRLSPGVILTAGGFLGWSLVWGFVAFAAPVVERTGVTNLIWDVPKFFVGFGMIVTLLEDQYFEARSAGRRERILNIQMMRFADLTSKLLGGVEVRSLCGEIARVINEVANFRRVVIAMFGDNRRPFVAGDAGIDGAIRSQLESTFQSLSPEDVIALCNRSRKIGQDSYIYTVDVARTVGSIVSRRHYDSNPYWKDGDELIVPIRAGQGNVVGFISMDDPKSVRRVTPEEISKIEMLANDIGVAIEKNTLQRKVMLHEKLASVGQLVSGVAHELNNPLTAVLGYTELMADADKEGHFQREISIVRREAHRMKVIIDNLLRFARQSRSQTTTARLDQALQEAITLREYDIIRAGVDLQKRIEPGLPPVMCDEAQIKTVLVHLVNNAIDAMKETPTKQIQIEARRNGDRVLLSVIDNGPGFSDLTRVFDPFFTTKAVGRGTGLGLSICYGIVKQHGGEILAQNVSPHGACISIELLVATEEQKAAAITSSTTN
jgi:two-component system NtrC family sensor kinase